MQVLLSSEKRREKVVLSDLPISKKGTFTLKAILIIQMVQTCAGNTGKGNHST